MSVYLQDSDFTLYNGDALEVLRTLPDESVHCCVTSPPFFGLRDYQVEGQIGLEETPEQWVQKLVEVFREVRRVLRHDATLWLECGDSFLPGKQLGGMPWLLAFALRADGWYLRSDIVWSRSNPMPESVTDRPTKSHSYVFLLSKSARYFFDQEAVREDSLRGGDIPGGNRQGVDEYGVNGGWAHGQVPAGRNIRSVWNIATQPYPEAHFATYPEELVRRCILAGTSERGCCPECGAPWLREVEADYEEAGKNNNSQIRKGGAPHDPAVSFRPATRKLRSSQTLGWRPSCECGLPSDPYGNPRVPIPCTVIDPFSGSGTTALVARKHGRKCIGIELSADYCELSARRLQQLSLLSEGA